MASLLTKRGKLVLQFVVDADDKRKRQWLWLGKISNDAAEEIKVNVECILNDKANGRDHDRKLRAWINEVGDRLHSKMADKGLVEPRAPKKKPHVVTLGVFIDEYLAKRKDLKPRTRINLAQVKRDLIAYFGDSKPIADVTAGDADDWRVWLATDRKLADDPAPLGINSVRRHCSRARQLFRAAIKRRKLTENPFGEMKDIRVRANDDRFFFVDSATTLRVIAECKKDTELKVIIALTRWGGLRCPSEVRELKWTDIDWNRRRMVVRSPKTERHPGHESRVVPIYDELLPCLRDAFEAAEDGAVYVAAHYRRHTNLGTQLQRIIKRAGVEPWPKLFQNLRITRQTELARDYPAHVVCAVMGNSEAVAKEHYLKTTDADLDGMIGGAPLKAPLPGADASDLEQTECEMSAAVCDSPYESANLVPPRGVEPRFSD